MAVRKKRSPLKRIMARNQRASTEQRLNLRTEEGLRPGTLWVLTRHVIEYVTEDHPAHVIMGLGQSRSRVFNATQTHSELKLSDVLVHAGTVRVEHRVNDVPGQLKRDVNQLYHMFMTPGGPYVLADVNTVASTMCCVDESVQHSA